MGHLLNKFKPNIFLDINEKSKIINPNIYLENNKIKYENVILTNIINKNNKVYLYYLLFFHNIHKPVILNINEEKYDHKYPIFENESLNKSQYYNYSNVDFKDFFYFKKNDNILPINNYSYIYSSFDQEFNNQYKFNTINIISIVIEIDKNEQITGVCLIPNIIKDIFNNYKSSIEPYWIRDKKFFNSNTLSFYISYYNLNPYLIHNDIKQYIGSISFCGDIFNKYCKLDYDICFLSKYCIKIYNNDNSFLNIPTVFYIDLSKFIILDKHHLKWLWYKKKNLLIRLYKYFYSIIFKL